MEKVFTPEEVINLNRYQKEAPMHPFTCGHDHAEPRALVATEEGWICPFEGCSYTQNWAHDFVKDGRLLVHFSKS